MAWERGAGFKIAQGPGHGQGERQCHVDRTGLIWHSELSGRFTLTLHCNRSFLFRAPGIALALTHRPGRTEAPNPELQVQGG